MDWDFPTARRSACALAAIALLSAPSWAAGPTVAFYIPAGSAPQTLREFFIQSQVRVLYLADTVKGVETQAISGTLEASEALARMLEGTGLTYTFENEYSAMIQPAAETAMPRAVSTPASSGQGPAVPASGSESSKKIEEVLVTGSLIHGVFDITSPLVPVEREEMKRAAYATVQDAVWALPMAATITQSEIFGSNGNINRGTGINLRGLGYAPTLVLVNGRRQPLAGTEADFVDVSNIPWSIVERIEVLADGSSALYGSDAIAGVVNILLRQDLEGAESQLRYGLAPGGGEELLAAQLLGHRWGSGQWLAGYQYSKRSSLAAAERDYVVNGDKRPLGGRDFRSTASSPGNILDPQTLHPVFAIPRGQDGRSLTPEDLLPGEINYRNAFADSHLLPERYMHSAYLRVSQDLTTNATLFAEGRYSERGFHQRPLASAQILPVLVVPETNPFFVDPFGDSPFVVVAYDLSTDRGPLRERGQTRSYIGTLGVTTKLFDSWQVSLSASHGGEDLRRTAFGDINPFALDSALADPDPATAFNPFGDGTHTNPATVEILRSINQDLVNSTISSIQFMADGTLFYLPSGPTRVAVGAEYRQEALDRRFMSTHFPASRSQFGRKIAGVFTELSIPIIGHPANPYSPPRLELSLAGRYEHYDDFGHTYNPKIGVRWTPFGSIKFRASWGTSFKAPNLVDLSGRSGGGVVSLRDPRAATGRSNVLVIQGSNPNLDEERATTWTAGFDFAPEKIPGLQFSMTGYSIKYQDQVIQPGLLSPLDILLHEDEWRAVITRNPSLAQIAAVCADPGLFGDCGATPPTVFLDARKQNLAITNVKGLDLALQHAFDTKLGEFSITLNGTRVLSFKRAFTQNGPAADIADTVNNPLGLRLRGMVEWHRRPDQYGLGISATVYHAGGYRDVDSTVRPTIGDWTTFDMGLTYRFRAEGKWADNTELMLNVANVLDEEPPFVDREVGYDMTNAQPVGRVVSAYISKSW